MLWDLQKILNASTNVSAPRSPGFWKRWRLPADTAQWSESGAECWLTTSKQPTGLTQMWPPFSTCLPAARAPGGAAWPSYLGLPQPGANCPESVSLFHDFDLVAILAGISIERPSGRVSSRLSLSCKSLARMLQSWYCVLLLRASIRGHDGCFFTVETRLDLLGKVMSARVLHSKGTAFP